MELLVQASVIMVLGMSVTFAFLGVVIAGVNMAAWIIHRIEGAPTEAGNDVPQAGTPDRRKIVAAIAAALHQHPSGKP